MFKRSALSLCAAHHFSSSELAMKSVALFLALTLAALQPALGSAPVHRTMVGCVADGVFTNDGGYVIKIREKSGGLMNLSRWQQQRLQITGSLLPGDNFYLTGAPVVLGPCR
jgi:hypothetical protein